MEAIVTVMSTTLVVVKVRPEKNAVNCDWRDIYDFHIFTVIYSPLWGFIWNQHNDQLPVGLLAQLVEHCTSIALVLGPNLVQAWIFFRSYFHYHWSSVRNCKDGFHLCVKCSILGRFIHVVAYLFRNWSRWYHTHIQHSQVCYLICSYQNLMSSVIFY